MASPVDQVPQRRRGVGLIAHDPALSAGGYSLIAPQTADGHVYLVDIEGRVAHEWKLPVRAGRHAVILPNGNLGDRKSTRLNSSHQIISYAVFCLKKKKKEDLRLVRCCVAPSVVVRIARASVLMRPCEDMR